MSREVVIVGKTRKRSTACVGALDLRNAAPLRIQRRDESDFPLNTTFEIGEMYEIEGRKSANVRKPHTEGYNITSKKFIGEHEDVEQYILDNTDVVTGSWEGLFDGVLQLTSTGKLRVTRRAVPAYSTTFWVPNHRLTLKLDEFKGKVKVIALFKYGDEYVRIPYVGFAPGLDEIRDGKRLDPGTLIRISLATWFRPKPDDEEACYAQLSGWF